jgi:hypothetical protein
MYPSPYQPAALGALAFSPNGRYLAMSQGSAAVQAYDVLTGKELDRLTGHAGPVTCLVFTADGRRLISGSLDTTAIVWDVAAKFKPAAPAADKLDAQAQEKLWADLGGKDGTQAFEALRVLLAHPGPALALARAHLKPVAPPDAQRVAQLLAELNSPKFDVRQKAAAELETLGDVVVPDLNKVLANKPSLEVRQRVEAVLKRVAQTGGSPALTRDLRVLELLELQGGTEVRQYFETLAGGAAGARLTIEARAALERMAK